MDQGDKSATRLNWKERAKRIRLLLLDVDGILTDGRIVYDGSGREVKFFHIRDGQGIRLLQRAGIKVGILTGRASKAVDRRARELEMSPVLQKIQDKGRALQDILRKEKVRAEEVCYAGDDLVDLAVLTSVGLAVTVPEASREVKAVAQYTTRLPGGQGAVREITEMLLKAQGKWEKVIRDFTAEGARGGVSGKKR
jgi:3-deoxy-D-manno-octulosonate 8-phosphate phosphatase (KDO 8-P phosphatase)